MKFLGKMQNIIMLSILALGIIALLYGAVDSLIDKIKLPQDYRYTISYRVSLSTRSKRKYFFKVKEHYYSGFTSLGIQTDKNYFIKFYSGNPKRSQPTKIIADSLDIKNLPPEGYKELPHR